jgi:hypothetical protein
MRTMLSFTIVIGIAVFAGAQTLSAPKSNWLADSVTRDGAVLKMHGHVRIAACSIITADDAIGGPDVNDTELRGNVHVKVTSGVDPLQ